MRRNPALLAFLVISTISSTNGYVFPCLDKCTCDTDDEAIHCHNGERNEVMLSEKRLRGFSILGFTNNKLKNLPAEEVLLDKFPDLKAIDIEGNPDVNCSSFKKFDMITIYSDCEGSEKALLVQGEKLPDIDSPTQDCDLKCQFKKNYRTFEEYIVQIWKKIQTKYREFNKEDFLREIEQFFVNIAHKVTNLREKITLL